VASPTRTDHRSRNPRGQGERLREALLEAAIELLAEAGDVEALSVRAVTAHVGVTPTALYLHFANRDELLEAVKDSCFRELRGYVLAAEREAATDPREQAQHMCMAYLRFAAELPGHYRVLFHTQTQDAPADPVLVHARTREAPAGGAAAASVTDIRGPQSGADAFADLVRGVQRCLPPERDAFGVAVMVWAGMHGYAMLRESLRRFPLPDASSFIKQLLDAHLLE
jgi:AcrR family transcriptional regulator